jgi:hypothetical protein
MLLRELGKAIGNGKAQLLGFDNAWPGNEKELRIAARNGEAKRSGMRRRGILLCQSILCAIYETKAPVPR